MGYREDFGLVRAGIFSHPARHVGRVGSDDDRRHLYRTRRGKQWNRGGQYLCAAADGADGLRPDGGNGQFDNRISLPFEGQGPHGACECHPGAAFRDGRRSALGRRRHAFSGGDGLLARLFRTFAADGGGLSRLVRPFDALYVVDGGRHVRPASGRCSETRHVVQPACCFRQCGARLALYFSFRLGREGGGIRDFDKLPDGNVHRGGLLDVSGAAPASVPPAVRQEGLRIFRTEHRQPMSAGIFGAAGRRWRR